MSTNAPDLIKEPNPAGTGAPVISDDQFKIWLDELRPHLELGVSLWRAMEKSALTPHMAPIYKKYRLRDWFAQKIDAIRAIPGENVNEAFTRLVNKITDKVKRDEAINDDERDILKFFAAKHRTAQPFFVDRQEQSQAKPEEFGRIVDIPVIEYVTPEPEVENTNPEETKTDESTTTIATPTENPVGTEPQATPSVAPTG